MSSIQGVGVVAGDAAGCAQGYFDGRRAPRQGAGRAVCGRPPGEGSTDRPVCKGLLSLCDMESIIRGGAQACGILISRKSCPFLLLSNVLL